MQRTARRRTNQPTLEIFENDGFAVFSIAIVSMEFIWGNLSKTLLVLPAHLRLRRRIRKLGKSVARANRFGLIPKP